MTIVITYCPSVLWFFTNHQQQLSHLSLWNVECENGILSTNLILWIYSPDNHLTQIIQAKEKLHVSGDNAMMMALVKQR